MASINLRAPGQSRHSARRTCVSRLVVPADLYPHTRHDHALQNIGVYSIAAYLNAWNRHVIVCSQLIPPSRRLILRTHELGRSHQQLADFLQISVRDLDILHAHSNRGTWPDRLESLVDRNYLVELVSSICQDNMARHFPDVANIEDAYQLWGPRAATMANRVRLP
jgi:hypothetical protein